MIVQGLRIPSATYGLSTSRSDPSAQNWEYGLCDPNFLFHSTLKEETIRMETFKRETERCQSSTMKEKISERFLPLWVNSDWEYLSH